MAGATGPTGGPAFTDVLGTMLAWDAAATVVEREDGTRVTIGLDSIVSGKPVPPRPSVRLRVDAAEAERRAARGWPAVDTEPLGGWLLRSAAGFSARACSALVLGSPKMPLPRALAEVERFYRRRGLPPLAQVVSSSAEDQQLVAAGWVPARPGEADTEFLVASVAQVARQLRSARRPGAAGPGDPPGPRLVPVLTDRATDAWLAGDERAQADPAAARAVLEGPAQVAFVTLGDPVVAKGRVSAVDDWAGITDVWVSSDRRREGLALEVLRALVDWAAESGATTAYLQVRGDNRPALALYDRLGFGSHHAYRYLRPS